MNGVLRSPSRRIAHYVRSYPRTMIALALGVLAGAACTQAALETRVVIGCAVGATVYLASVFWMMARVDEHGMLKNARRQDVAPMSILVIAVGTATLGVFAIVVHLTGLGGLKGWAKAAQVGLALWSVVAGWAATHLAFTLHYAHEFYRRGADGEHGGVEIPNCPHPDYWDFVYFAFTIGVAAATADANITSRAIRRVATVQGVIAFFYNLAILGLFVNVAAGLASSSG
jgi:uncharacterized membrane protein